jgi:uncharacterized heparinase superfamily protein
MAHERGEHVPRPGNPETASGRLDFLRDPSNWPLVVSTARNMTAVQLAGILERKARHAVVPRLPLDFDGRYRQRVPETLSADTRPVGRTLAKLRAALTAEERSRYRERFAGTVEGRYTYLGRRVEFGETVDWDHDKLDEFPLLWRLKLQAFEHLEWLVLGYDSPASAPESGGAVGRQIASWAAASPIGEPGYLRRSWIPHAVSLRILNWSRYAAWCRGSDAATPPERLFRELYRNALFLSNHVEHEVGGNHLIENAIALITAGVVFRDHDTGWVREGVRILRRAGRRQFLADGGHFERSPMYHAMVLRRYLTACDLLADDEAVSGLAETAGAALGFLAAVAGPGDEMPLLNDAVRGEQPSARACLAYGRACGVEPRRRPLDAPGGSGYLKLSAGDDTMLVDVGDVGPPHLPAHSHNDQLSVLCWVGDQALLTDTGVYDYGNNPRRRYARSVRAHNTAQYEDVEPVPIGGRYLMGRRAETTGERPDDRTVRARCERRASAGPGYTHRRTVTATAEGWTVTDRVTAQREGTVTVRYHFHPSTAVTDDGGAVRVQSDGSELATLEFSGATAWTVATSPYYERYGDECHRPCVTVSSETGRTLVTRITTA